MSKTIDSIISLEEFDDKFGEHAPNIAFKTWEDLDNVKSFIHSQDKELIEALELEKKQQLKKVIAKIKKLKLSEGKQHCEKRISSWQKCGYYQALNDVVVLLKNLK